MYIHNFCTFGLKPGIVTCSLGVDTETKMKVCRNVFDPHFLCVCVWFYHCHFIDEESGL